MERLQAEPGYQRYRPADQRALVTSASLHDSQVAVSLIKTIYHTVGILATVCADNKKTG